MTYFGVYFEDLSFGYTILPLCIISKNYFPFNWILLLQVPSAIMLSVSAKVICCCHCKSWKQNFEIQTHYCLVMRAACNGRIYFLLSEQNSLLSAWRLSSSADLRVLFSHFEGSYAELNQTCLINAHSIKKW